MRLSIRRKLTLFVCGPMIAIYGGLLLWGYDHDKAEAINQVTDMFGEKVHNSAEDLASRLEPVMAAASTAAATALGTKQMTEQQLHSTATAVVQKALTSIASVIVVEPTADSPTRTGAAVRRMGANIRPYPLSDFLPTGKPEPDWYTTAQNTLEPKWTVGSIENRNAGIRVYWYTVPVIRDDRLIGALAIALRAQVPQNLLTGHFRYIGTTARAPQRPRAQEAARQAGKSSTETAPAPDPADEPETSQAPMASTSPTPTMPPQPWSLASQFGPDGFFIIDHEQRIVSHPDVDRVGKPLFNKPEFSKGPDDPWSQMLAKPSGVLLVSNLNQEITGLHPDTAHFVAFAQVPDMNWILVTTIPRSLVTAPIVAQLRQRALLLLAGVAVVALIIALVSVRMSRPIEGLARAVQRLSAGDLDAQVPGKPSHDEIGTLTVGFNSMVTNLKEQIEARAKETAARETIEAELRFARQIQQDLLPDPTPDLVGRKDFDLHAINIPARRVAGDFYDYFLVAGKLVIVIADVSGKGMPAALLMAVARTAVRDYAGLKLSPAAIASHANQAIFEGSEDSMFVTMFLAQYDPATGNLSYVCAGHPPPYILHSNGNSGASAKPAATPLGRSTAPLLGVFPAGDLAAAIEQGEHTLAPGETLFLYTDGVTEARAPSGRMVTEEGLARALSKIGPCDSRSLCDRILASLQRHERGLQNDDITMLALRRVL
jgi:sigma-B regulation protein RsbU (phosphoserine phosphatase)